MAASHSLGAASRDPTQQRSLPTTPSLHSTASVSIDPPQTHRLSASFYLSEGGLARDCRFPLSGGRAWARVWIFRRHDLVRPEPVSETSPNAPASIFSVKVRLCKRPIVKLMVPRGNGLWVRQFCLFAMFVVVTRRASPQSHSYPAHTLAVRLACLNRLAARCRNSDYNTLHAHHIVGEPRRGPLSVRSRT